MTSLLSSGFLSGVPLLMLMGTSLDNLIQSGFIAQSVMIGETAHFMSFSCIIQTELCATPYEKGTFVLSTIRIVISIN